MSLKSDIERELGIPIRMRIGSPGSFRVLVNGEELYSKKQTGLSPNPAEIIGLIREKNRQP